MNDRKASKHYFRQRLRNRLYEDVIKAIEVAASESGLRRKDIAERLGVSPSQVSRWLAGPSNWGIDTASDLMFAIDAELDFRVEKFKDRKKRNEFHPVGTPIELPLSKNDVGSSSDAEITLPPFRFDAKGILPAMNEAYNG